MTAASTSVHSIALQVTECRDSSTQTLSEVGVQTDLSAVSAVNYLQDHT